MITSKKLSLERINEIKNFPIVYDEDNPKLTSAQIARMKPVHPEYWRVEPVKKRPAGDECLENEIKPNKFT